MQKGYKRNAKWMAVLRCFIGLFSVIIVVLIAYFYLQVDYTDKLDPSASIRPYVETTPSPTPDANAVLPAASASPEITSAPTPRPTAVPTATPTPSPSPTPSPEPTSMASNVSAVKTDGFALPGLSQLDGKLGITYAYRSAADDNKILHLQGYAYINEETYDGSTAQLFLVVTQATSGNSVLVLPNKVEGISNHDHSSAICANAAASDFEAFIDVSAFPSEIYSLGMVFMYTGTDGQNHIEYFKFPDSISFTVLDSRIITDIAASNAE